MKLSSLSQGRDNNFNLLRILAAFAVLFSHSFALAIGSSDAEPLRWLGTSWGLIAVDVFFIISGFLVTGSLFSRQSAIEFVWARILRIYPALLVVMFLTVFVLGAFFTRYPLSAYLASPETHAFLFKNMTLFLGWAPYLPGVFETTPFRGLVNGSLWTMPLELRMYAILVAIWIVLRAIPSFRQKAFQYLVVTLAILAALVHIAGSFFLTLPPEPEQFVHFSFMFFTGAAFYVLRGRISMSGQAFWIALALLALSVADPDIFFVVYNLVLAYVVLYVAHVPSGNIRKFNNLGDYSYGVYIYAFPVQQSVAALIPGVTVWSMLAISSVATLSLAALSWHLLEKHALGLKGHCVENSRRVVNYLKTGLF